VLPLQVDATVAKSVQRVTGSVIGAVYAFLVMLRPVVASNPYAVGAMCCFSAFMCGLLVEHRFRYGSFLALYTSAVVMLAQVGCSCDTNELCGMQQGVIYSKCDTQQGMTCNRSDMQ